MRVLLLVEGRSDRQTLPILTRKLIGGSIGVTSRLVGKGDIFSANKVEVHIKTAVARQKDIFKAVLCIDSECTEIDKTVDCLNIDMSESLVKLIARQEGMDETSLGVKGKQGIVQSKQSRAAFLSDPEHQIVFHYTPKHTSWMNQIELWFSILAWKLLKRASLVSKADLKARVLAFIDYFNRTMAKPFKWTYKGKVLAA